MSKVRQTSPSNEKIIISVKIFLNPVSCSYSTRLLRNKLEVNSVKYNRNYSLETIQYLSR